MAIRPLSGYIGGKWFLRKTLCPIIDATPHRSYVEVFLGMGNIFLGREKQSKVEVINDVNGEVVNLFRQVQRHPEALMAELRFALTSRREYHRLRILDPTALTELATDQIRSPCQSRRPSPFRSPSIFRRWRNPPLPALEAWIC